MKINNTETPKIDNYLPGSYNPSLKLNIKDIKGNVVTPVINSFSRKQTDLIISGWRWFPYDAKINDIFDQPGR